MTIEFVDLKSQYKLLKKSINSRIQSVLNHGQYILGPEVLELEEKLAKYTGTQHCITTASGTIALLMSLMALEIQPGDEVITTPFTFAATAEMIVLLGAVPVFVDIQPDTYQIDYRLIPEAITPKTKAILPVSLFGQIPDMDAINQIASEHNIPVIEDAAQSFGAKYKNRKSCNLSTIGCTSFFPSKPLSCYGDGGAIFTNSDILAKKIREIRIHGQMQRYHHTSIGISGCMDTIQCAILLAKLEKFDEEIDKRQQIALRYYDFFKNEKHILLPKIHTDSTSVWSQFTIRTKFRDFLAAELKKIDIPTAIHYPIPLSEQLIYRSMSRQIKELENCKTVSSQILSLPMSAYISKKLQIQIMHCVRKILADRQVNISF